MRAWGRTLRGVRLEGAAPATRLMVDFYDEETGRVRSLQEELWDPGFEDGEEGLRSSPDYVAWLIGVHMTSPGPAGDTVDLGP